MITSNDILQEVKALLNYSYDDTPETEERLKILIEGAMEHIQNAGYSKPETKATTSTQYIICVAQFVTLTDETDVDVAQLEKRFYMNLSNLR